jgi:ABC-2 type transport system ATP-binding protein
MTSPLMVRVDDLSKRFVLHKDKSLKERVLSIGAGRNRRDDFWALRDVSLEIASGDTIGLVGHNGSGKSTLLKTIGGIIEPTSGRVERRGRLAALLELGAGFHPDLSGRENVYHNAAILGLTRRETDRYFDSIVDFAEISEFIDTQVKFYSSGMYVRLAFAVAIHVDPDLLLVDEVLAVGDEPFQRKCLDKIAEFQSEGRTIVLVSHSADQVGRLCNRVAVLDHGSLAYDGNPETGLQVLRQRYERTRVTRAGRHDETEGSPIQLISADAELSRGDGRLPRLQVKVKVVVREPRPQWVIGVSLDTSLGMRLYEANTLGLNTELPNAAGEHEVVFDMGGVSLGAGNYLVNVGIGGRDGETFDRLPGAASFEVPAIPLGRGLIRLDPVVTVQGR